MLLMYKLNACALHPLHLLLKRRIQLILVKKNVSLSNLLDDIIGSQPAEATAKKFDCTAVSFGFHGFESQQSAGVAWLSASD